MLPASYELPAALLITAGGVIACIAGYRLFRIVLAIYGFVLGAVIASSIVGPTNTLGMIGAALGGGLGALVSHAAWTQFGSGDPPALLIVGAAVAGAVAAMFLQRYVIVVSTAFGGAWTIIVGLMAILGGRSGKSDVWILYPTMPSESRWTLLAWVALGIAGTAIQLAVTARTKR